MGEGDKVGGCDGVARVAGLDEVEGVAVGDEVGLGWKGCEALETSKRR